MIFEGFLKDDFVLLFIYLFVDPSITKVCNNYELEYSYSLFIYLCINIQLTI